MHATKLILLAGDDSRKAELQLIEEINRADRIRMVHIMAAKTGGNRNTLHVAADSGCVKNLRTIISALSAHDLLSDYIDCPCDAGMAPLHYAAKGHPRCVTLLLQQGANVNAVNKAGNTPLHFAATNFQPWMVPPMFASLYECIELLLNAEGMDLSLKNANGQTPLGASPNKRISSLKRSVRETSTSRGRLTSMIGSATAFATSTTVATASTLLSLSPLSNFSQSGKDDTSFEKTPIQGNDSAESELDGSFSACSDLLEQCDPEQLQDACPQQPPKACTPPQTVEMPVTVEPPALVPSPAPAVIAAHLDVSQQAVASPAPMSAGDAQESACAVPMVQAMETLERNDFADSPFPSCSAPPSPSDLAPSLYTYCGLPIENIMPLFDKDAKAENRAASMRLMLRGSFVTLHPVTKAVVERKECVIKSASIAEDAEPSKENLIALKRECDNYQIIQSDNINTGCVFCYTAHPEFNYLLLERFGRDIRSLIANKTKHPEELFEGIAQAVRELHSMEIMHGDIKPQNILYEVNPVTHEFVVKLCDLDCARRVGEECPAVEIGTKRYVAPEVYKAAREGKTIKASLAFDMFSLGLVLWQVVQGSVMPALPSPDTTEEDLLKCYTDQQYLWGKMPLDPSISYLYAPFVQSLTALDPAERMTAEQLKCRIPELSSSHQQILLQKKAEENAVLMERFETLKVHAIERLASVAIDVKTVMHEQRDARAEVDGMLRTLITNTHSIPTLAIILPKVDKPSSLPGMFGSVKPMQVFKNQFRLFFLCSHTREMVRCGPKGRGYKITVTKQWVADAAPVLRVGLLLLKLGLMAGGVPLPVPDISPLLRDRDMYGKYLDAALSFVVDSKPSGLSGQIYSTSHVASAPLITVDDAIHNASSLEVEKVLDAYATGDGLQLEEGSRKAYETIHALLVEKEKHDVVGTCGLKMVTYKGKTAWVKDDPNVIRQFEESLRY